MPFDPTGLLVGGGLLAASQLFGNKGNSGQDFLNKAYGEYNQLTPPTAEELQYQVQQLQLQGIITPQQADAIMQDPSLMAEVIGSPEAKAAQMQALSQLQGISREGGMTAEDKANLAEIQGKNAAAERGSREAIAMNARERGISGSGIDMVNQMLNEQGSAGNQNLQGLEVAKQAQARALAAIQASGQLGGQIEGQQFGEESSKATAQDAINKFNAANKQNVGLTNVATNNAAQEANLREKQRISDTNVALANQKAQADAAAKQLAYENQLKKVAGKTGTLTASATGAEQNQANNLAFQGSMIGAGGQVIANTAPRKVLNSVTGKWEYPQ